MLAEPPLALVIADAAPGAGLGHISRASGVAAALAPRGFEVRCLAYGAPDRFERDGLSWSAIDRLPEPGADVVVLDSYLLPAEEVGAGRLVVMSDSNGDVPAADMVVKLVGPPEDGPCRLVGLRYASLRPMFWEPSPKRVSDRVERVVVAVGDGEGITAGVAQTLPGTAVEHVQDAESLLAHLTAADLAVCGGGQTMLEAAVLGTPTIAIVLAENQRPQAELLSAASLVRLAEESNVAEAAAELAASAEERRRMSEAAQAAIDGRGALRIAEHVARLARSESS